MSFWAAQKDSLMARSDSAKRNLTLNSNSTKVLKLKHTALPHIIQAVSYKVQKSIFVLIYLFLFNSRACKAVIYVKICNVNG